MDHTNFFNFINKSYPLRLNFMIIITTIFIFLLKPADLSPDPKFQTCEPKKCNDNLTVKYPFWLSSQQESYCGHPNLKIICRNNKSTILISEDYYIIKDIFYQNQSLWLANSKAFDDSICQTSLHNLTLQDASISLSPNHFLLYFFFNCSFLPTRVTYPIPCANYNSSKLYSYAAYIHRGGWSQYFNASENCESVIAAPLHLDARETHETLKNMSYKELLQMGIVLNWNSISSSSCGDCERSGGRCGFDEKNQFICFCSDRPHPRSCKIARDRRLKIVIATTSSIGGGLMIVMAIVILYCFRKKRSSKDSPSKVEEFLKNYGSLAPKRYKYSDIKKMTNSFQDKLGEGGYGSVFKGQLQDGRMVAVKLLNEAKGNNNNNNGEEFINEVASISSTSHVNIVALLGFCIEGRKRALIYEFMPNGSLEKFIYIDNSSKNNSLHHQLGWDALYKIAIGIARGLEYLHRGCYTRIVHFDIKPHNILLDESYSPKISDFGLAKLCLRKGSIMSVMGARGTVGYIAPELVSRSFGRVSHKSDVYSYGMMVLEMVGHRKNVDEGIENKSEIYFPHWVHKKLLNQSEEIGLSGIMTKEDEEIARKLSIIALWCVQIDSSIRPSINRVLEMLEGSLEDLEIPPEPCFSSTISKPQETNGSDISVSDVI